MNILFPMNAGHFLGMKICFGNLGGILRFVQTIVKTQALVRGGAYIGKEEVL